jgi:V-type H+-transporting ATPase subunit d
MIDNVILIITGTLHERDTHELLERCHPLGVFDSMPALCVATTVAELFNTVLVETPLGKYTLIYLPYEFGLISLCFVFYMFLAPYFANCLSAHDLDELNIEIIRNTLYKAYLEDFYQFCQTLDGPTAEVMGDILRVSKKKKGGVDKNDDIYCLCCFFLLSE